MASLYYKDVIIDKENKDIGERGLKGLSLNLDALPSKKIKDSLILCKKDKEIDFENYFHYENNFYILAPASRFSKFITHLDLFRRISGLRGEQQCGVFKGNSLMWW